MDDQSILSLYWQRDPRAIDETASKYGGYCYTIARQILNNQNDAEETVNDTWLQTWNSIPPRRPSIFSSYLGTITRNLSLSRWRDARALKRTGDRLAVAYDELAESVPDRATTEDAVSARELGRAVDRFLRTLSQRDCNLFVCRYWYMDSIAQLAVRFSMPEGSVKSRLHHIRKKLSVYLQKEGYTP